MHLRRMGGRPIVEMNLIPLIDVSLILVIILMVLTPVLIQSQITVKLPEAKSGNPPPAETTIDVSVTRDGIFVIEGKPVRPERLEKELQYRLAGAAKKNVLVHADKAAMVDRVVQVLDAAKRLGAGKMGLSVVPPAP